MREKRVKADIETVSPESHPPNRFLAHPAATAGGIVAAIIVVLLIGVEVALRGRGLGDPIVYDTDPHYSYRPRPNQTVTRMGGAVVQINNIGIRAGSDWDSNRDRKVLFIGNSVTYGGSYVSNADLFAVRAVPPTNGWVGGSAGVNGWGVENMHALIVRRRFNPAKVYVTVLLKSDFFRGVMPHRPTFPTSKPHLALAEAVPHVLLRARARFREMASPFFRSAPGDTLWQDTLRANVDRAVLRLKEMDEYLVGRGFVHLIYLSPTVDEMRVPDDEGLEEMMVTAGIPFQRIQDASEARNYPRDRLDSLYLDGYHLSREGHALWAQVIGKDLRTCGVGGTRPLDCSAVGRYAK